MKTRYRVSFDYDVPSDSKNAPASDVEAVIVLPRESDWISLDPNCFHVWQSKCQQEGR
jgi:hypothetical protein